MVHPYLDVRQFPKQGESLATTGTATVPVRRDAATGGYVVDGFATVAARPHRSRDVAFRLASRLAGHGVGSAVAYLNLCVAFGVPGVADIRPTFAGRGAVRA